jgi:hypothetical protein
MRTVYPNHAISVDRPIGPHRTFVARHVDVQSLNRYNFIFQYHVALVKVFICRGSLDGATVSVHCCHFVIVNVTSTYVDSIRQTLSSNYRKQSVSIEKSDIFFINNLNSLQQ